MPVSDAPGRRPRLLRTPSGYAIAAPVFGSGGVHAILIAERSRHHTFDQAAVHFMQSVANVVGAALQASAFAGPPTSAEPGRGRGRTSSRSGDLAGAEYLAGPE